MSNNILLNDESDDESDSSEQPLDLEAGAYAAVLRELLGLPALENQSPQDFFPPLLEAIATATSGRPELAKQQSRALSLRNSRFNPNLTQIQEAQRLLHECRSRAEQIDLGSSVFKGCKGARDKAIKELAADARQRLQSTDSKLKFFALVDAANDPTALKVLETLSQSPDFWANDRLALFEAFRAAVATDSDDSYDDGSTDDESEYEESIDAASASPTENSNDESNPTSKSEDEDSDEEYQAVVKPNSDASTFDGLQSAPITNERESIDPEAFRRRVEAIVVANAPDEIRVAAEDAETIVDLILAHPDFLSRIVEGRCRLADDLTPLIKTIIPKCFDVQDSAADAVQLLQTLDEYDHVVAAVIAKCLLPSPDDFLVDDIQVDVDLAPELVGFLRRHVDKDVLQSKSHSALSKALAQKPPHWKRLRLMVAAGADVNAFSNHGISTKGDQRSFVHQIALKQAEMFGAPPPNDGSGAMAEQLDQARKLIQQLIDANADLLQWDDVVKSARLIHQPSGASL